MSFALGAKSRVFDSPHSDHNHAPAGRHARKACGCWRTDTKADKRGRYCRLGTGTISDGWQSGRLHLTVNQVPKGTVVQIHHHPPRLGKLAEWSIAAALNTVRRKRHEGSNPSLASISCLRMRGLTESKRQLKIGRARPTPLRGENKRHRLPGGSRMIDGGHIRRLAQISEGCPSGQRAHIGNVMVAATRHRSSNLRPSSSPLWMPSSVDRAVGR